MRSTVSHDSSRVKSALRDAGRSRSDRNRSCLTKRDSAGGDERCVKPVSSCNHKARDLHGSRSYNAEMELHDGVALVIGWTV